MLSRSLVALLVGVSVCCADVAPPPANPGDPMTQAAAGVILALGAFLLGRRYLRRRRERVLTPQSAPRK